MPRHRLLLVLACLLVFLFGIGTLAADQPQSPSPFGRLPCSMQGLYCVHGQIDMRRVWVAEDWGIVRADGTRYSIRITSDAINQWLFTCAPLGDLMLPRPDSPRFCLVGTWDDECLRPVYICRLPERPKPVRPAVRPILPASQVHGLPGARYRLGDVVHLPLLKGPDYQWIVVGIKPGIRRYDVNGRKQFERTYLYKVHLTFQTEKQSIGWFYEYALSYWPAEICHHNGGSSLEQSPIRFTTFKPKLPYPKYRSGDVVQIQMSGVNPNLRWQVIGCRRAVRALFMDPECPGFVSDELSWFYDLAGVNCECLAVAWETYLVAGAK